LPEVPLAGFELALQRLDPVVELDERPRLKLDDRVVRADHPRHRPAPFACASK
jgi:hypothetical protein